MLKTKRTKIKKNKKRKEKKQIKIKQEANKQTNKQTAFANHPTPFFYEKH